MQVPIVLAAFTTAFTLVAGSLPAHADEKAIHLDGAWARRAGAAGHGDGSQGAGNGAVYVKIANHAKVPDALISVQTDAAKSVEIHEVINDGGIMKMRPVPKLPVPAGGVVEMKPGGYHIMLLGLTRDLKPGDTVKLRLTFEKGSTVPLDARVR